MGVPRDHISSYVSADDSRSSAAINLPSSRAGFLDGAKYLKE